MTQRIFSGILEFMNSSKIPVILNSGKAVILSHLFLGGFYNYSKLRYAPKKFTEITPGIGTAYFEQCKQNPSPKES